MMCQKSLREPTNGVRSVIRDCRLTSLSQKRIDNTNNDSS